MRNRGFRITLATLFVLAVSSIASLRILADDDDREGTRFFTRLSTFNEVPPKANGASGTFRARLEGGTTLHWTLTWSGLTGPPLFAHIHFGLKGGNYPVMTFFCGGPKGNPDIPQKPDCPQSTSGSIEGTTTAADIIPLNSGANDQALDAHDFGAFLRALRAGAGYANMHTTRFPGGEIRGQISVRGREDNDDDR